MNQKKITLICDECYSRNYRYNKPQNHNKRLELNKYCKICLKTQLHKETR